MFDEGSLNRHNIDNQLDVLFPNKVSFMMYGCLGEFHSSWKGEYGLTHLDCHKPSALEIPAKPKPPPSSNTSVFNEGPFVHLTLRASNFSLSSHTLKTTRGTTYSDNESRKHEAHGLETRTGLQDEQDIQAGSPGCRPSRPPGHIGATQELLHPFTNHQCGSDEKNISAPHLQLSLPVHA